jgi:hypothetical protein
LINLRKRTLLNEVEPLLDVALITYEAQAAEMQRLGLFAFFICDFRTDRNALTPDSVNQSPTEILKVGARIGFSDMSSVGATILATAVGKVEIIVPFWISSKRGIVLDRGKIDRRA